MVQDVEIWLLGDVTGDGGGISVKYNDDGKVVISAPKPGNYKIIIASYSGKSLLKVQSADILLKAGLIRMKSPRFAALTPPAQTQ